MPSQPSILQDKEGLRTTFSGAPFQVSFDVDVTAGSLIVAFAQSSNGNFAATVVDDQLNPYTEKKRINTSSVWTAIASASGPLTVTMTPSASSQWAGLFLIEVSVDVAATLRLVSWGFLLPGSSPHVQLHKVGTPEPGLALAYLRASQLGTVTPDPGWTELFEDEVTVQRSVVSQNVAAENVTQPGWTQPSNVSTAAGLALLVTYAPANSYTPTGIEYLANRQFTAEVSVTPAATAWTDSAWHEVIPSADADLVITGVPVAWGAEAEFEIDIGIGSSGAEVAVTQVKGMTTQISGGVPPMFSIPFDGAPAGSRVSVRLRKTGTSVVAWVVALTYVKKPIVGSMLTTTKPIQFTSPRAAISTVPIAAAWADSASYTTLIASAAADIVIVAMIVPATNAGRQMEIDIAVDSGGPEVVLTTLRWFYGSGAPAWRALPNPLDGVLAGQRVSARIRHQGSASSQRLAIAWLEKPL